MLSLPHRQAETAAAEIGRKYTQLAFAAAKASSVIASATGLKLILERFAGSAIQSARRAAGVSAACWLLHLANSRRTDLGMAGFKTHITTSSVLGVAYGATARCLYDVPLPTCLLAGGLCGVSGMLPDLDSGPGSSAARERGLCRGRRADADDASLSPHGAGARVDGAVPARSSIC